MREQWRACRPYLTAYGIFMGSRVVLLLAIAFAAKFVPRTPTENTWDSTTSWLRYLMRYDSGWYLKILQDGYSYNGNDLDYHPVVFYPLYPLISGIVSTLLGTNKDTALLIVSNVSIFMAVPLFYKLIKDEYGPEVSLYAIAALSFFPTSLFFTAGYTESLALLLIVSFFLLLKRKRYFLAACCAGLATATRSTGLVLLLPLMWELWSSFSREPKRLALSAIAYSIIAVSGLLSYMLYLWITFNDPLVFMSGTRAWQGGKGTFSALSKVLTLQPFQVLPELWQVGFSPNAMAPWLFLSFILLVILFRKHLPTSYNLYALGVLLLPYLTLSGVVGFGSFARYILLTFPVFVALGILFKKRPWLGLCVLGLFAALLAMYTAMFAQWYWVG